MTILQLSNRTHHLEVHCRLYPRNTQLWLITHPTEKSKCQYDNWHDSQDSQSQLPPKSKRHNNSEMQDYMSHWQLQIGVATVGNYWVYLPHVKGWHPYMIQQGYFSNPETITLDK